MAHRARPVHRGPAGPVVRAHGHADVRRTGRGRTARVPARAGPGRGRAWYRGDCHLHSWYSDGRRTPAEIGALARAAGLDFINSAEHNTHSAHAHWADVAGDDLLVLLGEEVTTRNGHVVALGTDPGTFVDWRYRARDNRFGHFARRIRRAGGLVVPAHPHATCIGCNWKFGFGEADAVEVWNGPYTPDDEVALADWDGMLVASVREGRDWIPAMGSSDAHRDPDVIGSPQTVVLADDLTRRAVLDGIRAGRSYVAESSKVTLAFTASGGRGGHAGIGERLPVDGDDPVTVRLEVTGAPRCTVRFVTDQGVLFTSAPLPVSGAGVAEWRTTASYAAYVRAELRHEAAAGPLPGRLRRSRIRSSSADADGCRAGAYGVGRAGRPPAPLRAPPAPAGCPAGAPHHPYRPVVGQAGGTSVPVCRRPGRRHTRTGQSSAGSTAHPYRSVVGQVGDHRRVVRRPHAVHGPRARPPYRPDPARPPGPGGPTWT